MWLVQIPDTVRSLLAQQDNVVATWQLPQSARRAAKRASKRGDWQSLTARTYLAAPSQASASQRAWAAALHCGLSARLSARNALTLHGWDEELGAPFHVAVPHCVQPRPGPEWLKIHRLSLEPTGPAAQPPRTSANLATAHAAAWARTDREAAFVVISVLQQRLTAPVRLVETLTHMPRLPRRALIAELAAEFKGGSHSLNELDFAALCRRYKVPSPQRQTRRIDSSGQLRAIDVEFQTTSGRVLRLEIEGVQHLDPLNYFDDINRHNRLQIAGPAVGLRVSSWTIKYEPAQFMKELRGWVLDQ